VNNPALGVYFFPKRRFLPFSAQPGPRSLVASSAIAEPAFSNSFLAASASAEPGTKTLPAPPLPTADGPWLERRTTLCTLGQSRVAFGVFCFSEQWPTYGSTSWRSLVSAGSEFLAILPDPPRPVVTTAVLRVGVCRSSAWRGMFLLASRMFPAPPRPDDWRFDMVNACVTCVVG